MLAQQSAASGPSSTVSLETYSAWWSNTRALQTQTLNRRRSLGSDIASGVDENSDKVVSLEEHLDIKRSLIEQKWAFVQSNAFISSILIAKDCGKDVRSKKVPATAVVESKSDGPSVVVNLDGVERRAWVISRGSGSTGADNAVEGKEGAAPEATSLVVVLKDSGVGAMRINEEEWINYRREVVASNWTSDGVADMGLDWAHSQFQQEQTTYELRALKKLLNLEDLSAGRDNAVRLVSESGMKQLRVKTIVPPDTPAAAQKAELASSPSE